MAEEKLQQSKLFTGQSDARAAAGDFAADEIDHQIGNLKLTFDNHRRPAPQESAHPRQQFSKSEWFHQVVICPQLQPLDAMFNGAKRGKQQNRHPLIGGTQHAHDIPAVHVRQHNIEDYQIIITGHRQMVAIQPVVGQIDHKTGFG